MRISTQEREKLEKLCNTLRCELITLLHEKQTGHPGGSLSVCEILVALYEKMAAVDPQNPAWPARDRILLTKGHAAPMLYLILARKDYFPREEMATFRQINSRLQGHPSSVLTPGVELSGGPLGLGLSAAVGIALSLRLDQNPATVYAVLGDGELNEGTVWEACMSASKYGLDNLVAIVDYNGVQLDGTVEEIMPMGDLAAKFSAFGFEVLSCDGHDLAALCETIAAAKAVTRKPCVILAKTVKGKGVSFMEGQNTWHGAPINDAQCQRALADLGGDLNA